MNTTTRNATLSDLAEMLKDQHTRKVDVVAPATAIRSQDALIVVDGAEQQISMEGVTATDGIYRPTAVFDEGLASKLNIPVGYLKRMREERPDLYDANVNGWLHGFSGDAEVPADPRSFLVRAFRSDEGTGVARALLSDRYGFLDHLDALTAALEGVRDAMTEVVIDSCDLTDRRMYIRVVAPEVKVYAPNLLAGYRSPFEGASPARRQAALDHGWWEPGTEPVVFAGFEISNSETGGGAFQITPRMVVQVCKNGLKITKDAHRAVHLGGKLEEGTIRWSADTQQKEAAVITAKTRDAVASFLDVDYMTSAIARLEQAAGMQLGAVDKSVRQVGRTLQFNEAQIDGVLDHFIRGGQMTAGGVMHAVTSYAQTVSDADEAAMLEQQAIRALEVAAAL